jgi:hypothetical protein
MVIQKYWEQNEPLSDLTESFFTDELTPMLNDFISSERYKEYYSNHIIVEKHKNVARLFNKNTEEYIGIGFFNAKEKQENSIFDDNKNG